MRARMTAILAVLAVCILSCEPDDNYVSYVDESIHAILPLADGGAVWACVRTWYGDYYGPQKTSVPGPFVELLLLRTDAQRNLVWERSVENYVAPPGLAMRADADGGFIVAGFGLGSHWDCGGFVIKTDSLGFPIWNTTVADSICWGSVVIATADGGFAFFGIHYGQNRFRLTRVNAQGVISLRRDIDISAVSGFGMGGMVETDDGNFIITADNRLIGLSAQGDSLWTRRDDSQQFFLLAATPDGFAACGLNNSYSLEARSIVLETYDANGEVLRTQRWHAVEPLWPTCLLRTETGFFIAGTVSSGGYRIFTISTDPDGDNSRRRDISVTGDDHAQAAAPLPGGGLLLGGKSRVPHNDEGYGYDALLMWLGADGAPLGHFTFGI